MDHLADKDVSSRNASKIGRAAALLRNSVRTLAMSAVIGASLLSSGAEVQAAVPAPYIVNNDRGGFITDRLVELRNLRASGRRVEIRGRICYSTCTMLLGLPNTCISPDTQFGFHGPSKSGRRLAPDRFDHWSRVMAQYYPEQLSAWFMQTGRNKINGVHRIAGRDIIKMGVKAC